MKRVEEKISSLLQHDKAYLSQGISSLAGVDEAGRGPLAGPVVAAAVIVRDFSFSCSINDSKKMTPKKREEAFAEILSKSVVSIAYLDHEAVDEKNIYRASLEAMEKAILGLREEPELVLIDGPIKLSVPVKQQSVVGGDALSLSIASASIVAKVTRDRMMDFYDTVYPEYGFKDHKGYGTAAHLEALKKFGPCEIHRKSFDPVKQFFREQNFNAEF